MTHWKNYSKYKKLTLFYPIKKKKKKYDIEEMAEHDVKKTTKEFLNSVTLRFRIV